MGFTLDFTNETAESLDEGGRINQAGWYLTNLKDTYPDDESGERVHEFQVTAGIFKSAIQFVRLKNPDLADNPDTSARRSMKWAGRMGVAPIGKAVTWEELPWEEAIGKPFVLELEDDSYVASQGKNAGQTVHTVKPTYLGVYPPDHDRIPGNVRTALGLPIASKNGAAVAPTVGNTPGPVNRAAGKDGTQTTAKQTAGAGAATTTAAGAKPGGDIDVSKL